MIEIFYDSIATEDLISKNGCKLIGELDSTAADITYKKKHNNTLSLNSLRYLHFARNTGKTNLPPTEGAGKQHVLRVYCQLQMWLGIKIDATK